VLISEAVEKYISISEKTLRKATMKDYKSCANLFSIHLAKMKVIYLQDITVTNVFSYFDALRSKNSYTYNTHVTNLRTMFNFFIQREMVRENFIKRIKPLVTEKKERIIIDAATRSKLKDHFAVPMPYFWNACMLQYYCFIRRTELARIKMQYFDWREGVIRLPGSAAKRREKPRTVIIPHEFYQMLIDQHYHELPGHFAFIGDNTDFKPQPFNPQSIERVAKRLSDVFRTHCNKLGLPKTIKFYSWKDSGITEIMLQ